MDEEGLGSAQATAPWVSPEGPLPQSPFSLRQNLPPPSASADPLQPTGFSANLSAPSAQLSQNKDSGENPQTPRKSLAALGPRL